MNQICFIVGLFIFIFLSGCSSLVISSALPLEFGERQVLGKVELDDLEEISGLAASQRHQGVLWAHNDSGDGSHLYALSETGKHIAMYQVRGCWAFDWEDIAIGPGPESGVSYLYIGDIGDNRALRPFIQICRVAEPNLMPSSGTDLQGEMITLQYPEGPRDAEALMVDPLDKSIVIVTKREKNVSVFQAAYPHKLSEPMMLQNIARLPISKVTAADISPDGLGVLVMTTRQVFLWRRASPKEPMSAMFQRSPVSIASYRRELQDEAIGWASGGRGFYTASEELLGLEAKINFYPRSASEALTP